MGKKYNSCIKVKYGISYISAKSGPIATKRKANISIELQASNVTNGIDLPDSDWGDFSCRRAVDSSSYTDGWFPDSPKPSSTFYYQIYKFFNFCIAMFWHPPCYDVTGTQRVKVLKGLHIRGEGGCAIIQWPHAVSHQGPYRYICYIFQLQYVMPKMLWVNILK